MQTLHDRQLLTSDISKAIRDWSSGSGCQSISVFLWTPYISRQRGKQAL